MNFHFDPRESDPALRWTATTNDGGYDAAGATPLEAACALGDAVHADLLELSAAMIRKGNADER